ncbi:hypothetical protein OH76DRAFT_1366465, partial [Lentinus brumalis]
AVEQNEDRRNMYLANIGENYHAKQLVFVDESAFNWHTTKWKMGWALTGSRARRYDFFVHGRW